MGQIEYYSFERVLKELQIEEEELKRLVSEGEIRAFRDEDKMKFKRSDIEGLKKGRMTEPTIILPSGESDESSEDSEVLLVEEDTSETLLDIDDVAESSSTSVPTVDFSSSEQESEDAAGTSSGKETKKELSDSSASDALSTSDASSSGTIPNELTFEEDSGSYVLESSDDVLIDSSQELVPVDEGTSSGESTFIDSDTGLQTEPLEDIGTDEELRKASKASKASKPSRPSKAAPVEAESEPAEGDVTAPVERHSTRTQAVVPMTIEEPVSSGTMFCLVATAVLLLFGGLVVINTVKEIDTPLTGWLTDLTTRIVQPKDVNKSLDKHLQWRANRRDNPEKNYPNRED
jgi:hypothetical protein